MSFRVHGFLSTLLLGALLCLVSGCDDTPAPVGATRTLTPDAQSGEQDGEETKGSFLIPIEGLGGSGAITLTETRGRKSTRL